jgi:hypothetical protein
MSLMNAKTYFRARMNSLGYREWTDGFNIDNIPSTLFDRAYHIEMTGASGGPHNNQSILMEPSFLVRAFLKGFRNPASKIDEATVRAQSIIEDCIKASLRLDEPKVWNVNFDNLDIRPLETNDNAIIIELGFRCRVYADNT